MPRVRHVRTDVLFRWGVDRLPCLRLTILDMFKEGDFDYPYALKQVAFIGSQMYAFSQLSYLQVFNREADCTNASFVRPVKDALYYNAVSCSDLLVSVISSRAGSLSTFFDLSRCSLSVFFYFFSALFPVRFSMNPNESRTSCEHHLLFGPQSSHVIDLPCN